MYAFLSNRSACEALRHLGDDALAKQAWPQRPRKLPRWGNAVSTQRDFKAFCDQTDLGEYGVMSSPVDLLVPEASSRSRGRRASFHVWRRPLPACSMLRLSDRLFVSRPEFVLLQMAGQNIKTDPLIEAFGSEQREVQEAQGRLGIEGEVLLDDPFEWERKRRLLKMVLVACEFAGGYRLASGDKDTSYRHVPLMSCSDARAFADAAPRPCGASRMRTALSLAFDRSASPRETALALMLSLPVEYGGYGLPKPTLNDPLSTCSFETLWNGGETVTPDLLWKDAHLVIEYESDEFHSSRGAAKATSDALRANVLMAMGYAVLRATTGSVSSLVDLDRLALQVASHLGLPLAEVGDIETLRRRRLHEMLLHQ